MDSRLKTLWWKGNLGQCDSSVESKGSEHGGSGKWRPNYMDLAAYYKGLGLFSKNDEKSLKSFKPLELVK